MLLFMLGATLFHLYQGAEGTSFLSRVFEAYAFVTALIDKLEGGFGRHGFCFGFCFCFCFGFCFLKRVVPYKKVDEGRSRHNPHPRGSVIRGKNRLKTVDTGSVTLTKKTTYHTNGYLPK